MYDNFWAKIEKNKRPPRYIKKVKVINAKKFYNFVRKNSENKIKKIIQNLYEGDFYIIRGSVKKKFIDKLIKQLSNFSKKNPSSYYKMKENCPNFWRKVSENEAKKYSFMAIKDAYYFFRWNKENFQLWKNFNKIWSYLKYLGGLNFDTYEKNTPKNRIVDRIQIARYPENTGFCELHSHPPKNQRLIISVYMSEIKKDYLLGGTHFFKKKKKIKVEHKITKGDVGIFYSTLYHGVDPVKLSKYQKSKLNPGRWWCGLYSPESNHFKKRHTSSPARKIN